MQYAFILTVIIVGLSGIVAQIILLRELLVSFFGNELVVGVILGNWLICEGLGVFTGGRLIERVKNKDNLFVILQVIFALTLPLAVFLAKTWKAVLGMPQGEAAGLCAIFSSSFFIIFLPAFCHGGLFSCLCKLPASSQLSGAVGKEEDGSIGKVYAWENAGAIAGGVLLTYILIPHLMPLGIAMLVALCNLVACLFYYRRLARVLKYAYLACCVVILSAGLNVRYLHRLAMQRQWARQEVLESRNSIYGNVTVTQSQQQYTFFYNGLPIITSPYPDITFVQEFGNLPLLFHPRPRDILVIGGGSGGLISEILKYGVRKIEYAELDPLIIEMVKKYPSPLTISELADKRVTLASRDGRYHIRTTPAFYDVVFIGLSSPADLSVNRLFTQEGFALAKKRLNKEGILALWLPGSLAYISQELKDLNACVINGLQKNFLQVRVIPGDYNIILATDACALLNTGAPLIIQRIQLRKIDPGILQPAYLDYRLSPSWLDWFQRSFPDTAGVSNQDFRPVAVFHTLNLWNKQFSCWLGPAFNGLKALRVKTVLLFISVLTAILFWISRLRRNPFGFALSYSMVTTGFFGMLMTLILIFGFQVIHGYLFGQIGLLVSIFMFGAASASLWLTAMLKNIKDKLRLFIRLEFSIILFSLFCVLAITGLYQKAHYPYLVFPALFFLAGFLVGGEFSLASAIYLSENKKVGETAGILYFSDLLGSWIAGLLGGVLLLPVLGIVDTGMVTAFLKLGSLVLLIGSAPGAAKKVAP